jgi:hypothetical protein
MFIGIHTYFIPLETNPVSIVLMLSRCIVFSVDPVLECLYHVEVDISADVSEVHAA